MFLPRFHCSVAALTCVMGVLRCQGAGVDFRELDPLSKKRLTVTKVFGELWHWKEQVTPLHQAPPRPM